MIDPALAISLALTVLGGVVWAIRLEGKIGEHTQLFAERKGQAEDRNADFTRRLDDFSSQLGRIEGKLDHIAYSSLPKASTSKV